MKITTLKYLQLIIPLLFLTVGCGTKPKTPVKLEPKPANSLEIARQHNAYSHYINGLLLSQGGQLELAEQELNKALSYDPHSIEINYELASVYVQQQRYNDALQLRHNIADPNADFSILIGKIALMMKKDSLATTYFRKAVNKNPDSYTANSYFSEYWLKKNEADSALPYLKKVADLDLNDIQSRIMLGRIHINNRDYQSAISVFKEVLDADSLEKAAAAGLASIYRHLGENEKALEICTRMVKHAPEDIMFYSMKINAEIALDKFDDAIETGRKVLEMYPDNEEFIFSVAQLLANKEDFASAESLITNAITSNPEEASYKYLLAGLYMDEKRFEEAVDMLNNMIAENDTSAQTYILLATTFMRRDMPDSAISSLEEVIPKVDRKDQIYFQIGRIYAGEKNYEQAIDYYKLALDEKPYETNYRLSLAEIYDRAGQFGKAREMLIQLIDEQPKNATAMNNLAYMYINRGENYDIAEDYLQRALELDPDNGAFLDSYGWLLYKQGKPEEALEYIHKAVGMVGGDPELYSHLGDVYRALEDYEKAAEYYRKAIEMDPDDPVLKSKLDSLPAFGELE
ncbi:MAG: tetratricopeptide repeat protein [candidate division Zixibacteria bacterium]|nr:tetratricopeptide repeat protein [candidate division Zixibacteria bacterium]